MQADDGRHMWRDGKTLFSAVPYSLIQISYKRDASTQSNGGSVCHGPIDDSNIPSALTTLDGKFQKGL